MGALDLVIINAPEEVEQHLDDLVCTPAQMAIISKIQHALIHREFLHRHRILRDRETPLRRPAGHGENLHGARHVPDHAYARARGAALDDHLAVPWARPRKISTAYSNWQKNCRRSSSLSMNSTLSQKSRTTDDHGAMKRAVNSLLKNIDKINLIKNSVILIGATNHPQLLDEAAWRRFDEVVEFALPDEEMRKDILKKVTSTLQVHGGLSETGSPDRRVLRSDLRMMIKEADSLRAHGQAAVHRGNRY